MDSRLPPTAEWLEPDGRGGFASGTVSGIRTRRYHALLLTAITPPTGRMVLVNGLEAWVDTPSGSFALSSQRYAPDVIHSDGHTRIVSFQADPWPHWEFRLPDGSRVAHEVLVPHDRSATLVSWRLLDPAPGITLCVRPLCSGRDYHALQKENPAFQFNPHGEDGRLTWRPYVGTPAFSVLTNGTYEHRPDWYRDFLYLEEQARGLDCREDLASPGIFRWPLSQTEAMWIVAAGDSVAEAAVSAETVAKSWRQDARSRREAFASPLHRSADAYLAPRGRGKTIVAGYPWFTDWGRDTFIALRGLCLAAGRLEEARDILVQWAGAVSEGMLPNLFTDTGERPEFNSVDASLWYVIAVHEYLEGTQASRATGSAADRACLQAAVEAILEGYRAGTRYGIRMDTDGLLAAGTAGIQLTWMDAKVGDWVVTPRIGKPVEVQALWLNALQIGSAFDPRWREHQRRGLAAFRARFWNPDAGCLYDVIDVEHQPGRTDSTLRPNQIFAVGGLPFPLLDGDRARAIVDVVERQLWTPMGLRSLGPEEPGYRGHYRGGVWERDGAYHQGTVWPWLLGPFVEAWLRVRGGTRGARVEAKARFVDPLIRHLEDAGLGHVSEIADGDTPHTPRGCPFQAWSVGEVLRLTERILSDRPTAADPRHGRGIAGKE